MFYVSVVSHNIIGTFKVELIYLLGWLNDDFDWCKKLQVNDSVRYSYNIHIRQYLFPLCKTGYWSLCQMGWLVSLEINPIESLWSNIKWALYENEK